MEPKTFYWFLHQENPYASRHYEPNPERGLAWRTLQEVAFDLQKALSIRPLVNRAFFEPLDVVTDASSEAKEVARRENLRHLLQREGQGQPFFFPMQRYAKEVVDRYRVIKGTMLGVKAIENKEKVIEIRPHDTTTIIQLPVSAILSSHSTGFPKVAHSPERFLVGYRLLRDACANAFQHRHDIRYDWGYFQPETFSEDAMRVFSIFRSQWERVSLLADAREMKSIAMTLQRIDHISIADMMGSIAKHYAPPYIQYTELFMDDALLNDHNHPLIKSYLILRDRYRLIPKK